MQSYSIPTKRAEARLVEKKSEFLAVCAPVCTEHEALAVLEGVRTTHRTANHNVYAYVLREGLRQRYSDDGEPAKTAGLPVLEAIGYAGLSDCIVVVTRYFGGTLLGTGGLVRAYTAAANAAIAAAGKSHIESCVTVSVTLEYPLFERARLLYEEAGARLDEPVFTEKVALCGTLPAGRQQPLVDALRELSRGSATPVVSQPFYSPF